MASGSLSPVVSPLFVEPMQLVITLLLGLVWMASAMLLIAAMDRAARFRIDIPPGSLAFNGRSRIWQVNVFNPRNYSPEGRSTYRRLIVLLLVMIGAGLGCMFRIMASIP